MKGRRRLLLTMIIGAGCLLALLAGSALAVPQTAAAATKPAITIQPTDQTVEPGSLATFISTARGDPRPTVQWQQSHDGGRSWQAVPGATRYTLQVKATSGKDGFLYRAVFKNSAGTVKSRGALLDVRENVRFSGGHFARWIHTTFPECACCLAIEVKKFFLDEWTGEVDQPQWYSVGEALKLAAAAAIEELSST